MCDSAKTKEISFLTKDEVLRDQNFVCLSILTPELVKNCKIRAIKIRGIYSTEEEAKHRCRELSKLDPDFNIYVAPVGCWVPWCDDPDKANDCEYQNKELNKLMQAYKENQINSKEIYEKRKNEMIEKTIKEAQIKKDDKDEDNNDEDNTDKDNKDEDDVNKEESKISLDEINNLENKLNTEKKEIDNNKSELLEKERMSEHIKDELKRAEELYKKLVKKE
tara:strand:+ start:2271 stop:2933 length:663 start_codon:yes stop_codon:yes gene_type:complete